jgi:hypothetical protein
MALFLLPGVRPLGANLFARLMLGVVTALPLANRPHLRWLIVRFRHRDNFTKV